MYRSLRKHWGARVTKDPGFKDQMMPRAAQIYGSTGVQGSLRVFSLPMRQKLKRRGVDGEKKKKQTTKKKMF